jgi:hypothetical protein
MRNIWDVQVAHIVRLLQVTYSDGTVKTHGFNDGGEPDFSLSLAPSERVVEVFGNAGAYLYGLGFATSFGARTKLFGSFQENNFTVVGNVVGFFGGTLGGFLAGIGMYTEENARLHGPLIGTPLGGDVISWDDGPGYAGMHGGAALPALPLYAFGCVMAVHSAHLSKRVCCAQWECTCKFYVNESCPGNNLMLFAWHLHGSQRHVASIRQLPSACDGSPHEIATLSGMGAGQISSKLRRGSAGTHSSHMYVG